MAKDIGVTQKTAWFMLQRIRNCFEKENNNELSNIVEIDETYVGGKNKNRHSHKKVPNSQGRSTKDKTAILGMVERQGKLNATVVENVQSQTLTQEIIARVRNTAYLCTDEWLGYNGISRIYTHFVVKHNQNEYVNGVAHTNTIEGFWSLLKRGIIGIYHSVSKKHIQRYVNEFVFRYNTRNGSEISRFNYMLQNLETKMTYRELISG